jgi:hypothetical protein
MRPGPCKFKLSGLTGDHGTTRTDVLSLFQLAKGLISVPKIEL